jgi:hypothetical protein
MGGCPAGTYCKTESGSRIKCGMTERDWRDDNDRDWRDESLIEIASRQ